jgi:hypothetical protein
VLAPVLVVGIVLLQVQVLVLRETEHGHER